jgi:DNA repair ATPase RecN
MSEGFHVHGPHDHELEHAAHSAADSFAGRLAGVTAMLATLGAVFSYMGGVTQSAAMLYDNDAALKKTEADVQWADFQVKTARHSLSELAMDIVPEPRRSHYQELARRHAVDLQEIRKRAEQLDAESVALDERSNHEIHKHHRWAQATTVLQISIAMAAIALLTKRRWLLYGVYGLGGVGTALGAYSFMQA